LRGATLFLSGDTLFQTLMLNLISGRLAEDAAPHWELDDPASVFDRVGGTGGDGEPGPKRTSQSARGFVERYAWLSRMTRLVVDEDDLVRRAYFTQGREADKGKGDPMKVFVNNDKLGSYALNLNADKAAWRDLHSYLGATGTDVPRIFSHAAERAEDDAIPMDKLYRLNVVGLATDPGKAGKFLLWRHDRMSVPPALLAKEALIGEVATALEDAEFVARQLRQRMYNVAQRFLPPEGNPDPKDVDNLLSALDPRRAFWARLDAHFARFLSSLAANPEGAMETWRANVAREAQRALQASCNQLGESARALRATALVDFRFIANEAQVQQQIADAKAASKAKSKKGAVRG